MWWVWVLAVTVFIAVVVVVENRRGSKGTGTEYDVHRNAPDTRGGPGVGI